MCYTHSYTYIYIYIYICVYIHVRIYAYDSPQAPYICVYIHVYMCAYICVYIHVRIYAYGSRTRLKRPHPHTKKFSKVSSTIICYNKLSSELTFENSVYHTHTRTGACRSSGASVYGACINVCVCIYVLHILKYIHIYVYMCVYTCICVCVCIYIRPPHSHPSHPTHHPHACRRLPPQRRLGAKCTYMCVRFYVFHVFMYMYICMCVYTYIYIYIWTSHLPVAPPHQHPLACGRLPQQQRHCARCMSVCVCVCVCACVCVRKEYHMAVLLFMHACV